MHLVLLGSGLPDKPVVYHRGLRLFLNTQLLCCTALPGISRLYQEYIKTISRVYQEYIKSISRVYQDYIKSISRVSSTQNAMVEML